MLEYSQLSPEDSLYTSVVKTGLQNRILILNTEIDDCVIENCIMQIIFWNIEDRDIPKDKRQKIVFIINSIGGDVYSANALIDVIENSTTPIVGLGVGFVASSAYNIYLACHTKIAYRNTILLQHEGSLGIANSTGKVKDYIVFNDEMEDRTKKHILSHTNMTEDFYDSHYSQEFYMHADATAKELGVVDMIIGEDISLDEIF